MGIKDLFFLLSLAVLVSAPATVSAATLVDQIGLDDEIEDIYNLDPPPTGPGPDFVTYVHNYDLSGFTSITSALYEIEISGPGGLGGSPMEIFFDDNLIASSFERISDVTISVDLFSAGLSSFIDGSNTVRLQVYTINSFTVDYSRLTIGGTATAVPIPGAVWLFGTALFGLFGLVKRRKAA